MFPQGFLSDLLEKANRHYDDQKLQEYTQTIVRLLNTLTNRHRQEYSTIVLCYTLCRIISLFIDFHQNTHISVINW